MAGRAKPFTASKWRLITESAELAAFCAGQSGADFVTVDTEFMRERTYWPRLCLIQIAGPDEVVAIDALAAGIDLEPFYRLLTDPSVRKVFHAARQDIEIFVHQANIVPDPLFDTQVAAMVCGFGESAGYETLVGKIVGAKLDKTARMTNWSHRPLTDRQLGYAVSDVTYLRPVYEHLQACLDKSGRAGWLQEEVALIADPATYRTDPQDAWIRLRTRSGNGRFLAVLRELAAWREEEAMRKDVPRTWVLRDDTLMDIAAHAPKTREQLERSRGLPSGFAAGRLGQLVLDAVGRGVAIPASQRPRSERRPQAPSTLGPVIDLLRVLLKHKAAENQVAQKLIASAEDLERLAADEDAPALHGWRYKVFGADAVALKEGRCPPCF